MEQALKIFLLGRVEFEQAGQQLPGLATRRVEALLIYLACRQQIQSREQLADLLWQDQPQVQSRRNFNNTLYRLRKVLGDAVQATRQTVSLSSTDTIWLDVTEFEQQLDAVMDKPYLTSAEAAALSAGLALYQGDLLTGFYLPNAPDFEAWAAIERERLHQRAIEGLHQIVTHYLAQADYSTGLDWVQRLLALEAFDETAHCQMMRLLALNSQRSAALTHYERYQKSLSQEMGVEPASETQLLYVQIRDETLAPDPASAPAASSPQSQPSATPNRRDPYQILSRIEALPDQQLFGIEGVQNQLKTAIGAEQRPWLIAVDGMGGLGKTSLAYALVQFFAFTGRFADIGWVSAKQEELSLEGHIAVTGRPALDVETLTDTLLEQLTDAPPPAISPQEKQLILMQRLKAQPTLVVVDNLETVVDHESLLPYLRQLATPSKFLLTSRLSLKAQTDVYCLSLSELSLADTLDFLRHEAKLRSLTPFQTASTDQLTRIYDVVGGNPLALKLVLGQASFLPLGQVLENLQGAAGQAVDDLYTYIYWQGWQMLTPASQELWLSLPLSPNSTFDELAEFGLLPPAELAQSLRQLTTLSLVEVGGDLDQPRYRLHRLTETFLLNDVLKWGEAG